MSVPYARVVVEAGSLFRRCPVCKLHIKENNDNTGEQTTNHYAEHYKEYHQNNS